MRGVVFFFWRSGKEWLMVVNEKTRIQRIITFVYTYVYIVKPV